MSPWVLTTSPESIGGPSHAALARSRRASPRRSLSERPPQIPNLSFAASAYSRHSSRTGHTRQTAFGVAGGLALVGEGQHAGFTPPQWACSTRPHRRGGAASSRRRCAGITPRLDLVGDELLEVDGDTGDELEPATGALGLGVACELSEPVSDGVVDGVAQLHERTEDRAASMSAGVKTRG